MCQPAMPPSRLLTIAEVSAQSGYSVVQLRRWVRAGLISCFQPGGKGGKLLFPPDAFERALTGAGSTQLVNDAANAKSGPKPKWRK